MLSICCKHLCNAEYNFWNVFGDFLNAMQHEIKCRMRKFKKRRIIDTRQFNLLLLFYFI